VENDSDDEEGDGHKDAGAWACQGEQDTLAASELILTETGNAAEPVKLYTWGGGAEADSG